MEREYPKPPQPDFVTFFRYLRTGHPAAYQIMARETPKLFFSFIFGAAALLNKTAEEEARKLTKS